ncbi:MAG TPA: hypothetical protein VL754_07365 [Verrucomicrobiae bacterium]|jgi:hypothetical protein|nr:hypothetical protein [Verrucomicrobiae bacterium]
MNERATILTFTLAVSLLIAAVVFGAASSMSTASHSGGGVTVKATYRTPQPADELRFEVALDAHSVDLDGYDLKSIALLRDAGGKTYEPVRIENKGSGHHRDANVIFPRPPGGPQQVELIVKDIAGIKERAFRFKIS